ncbi:MAG: EAL domain-containing protein [Ilumatobacter sp.]|nr:EAL domain-containing protein [Ilumatobacter sp.]
MPSDSDDNTATGWGQPGSTFAPPSPTPRPLEPPVTTAAPPRSTPPPFGQPATGQSPAEEARTEPTPIDTPPVELPPSFDALLDADGSVVLVLDLAGTVLSVNGAGLAVLGAKHVDEIVPGSTSYGLLRSFLDHIPRRLINDPNGGTWRGDFDHIGAAGDPIVFRATATAQPDPSRPGNGVLAIIARDVTAARLEQARLHHRATHDPLTGLANRRQVLAILEDAIQNQRGKVGHVAALFIDLDRLKYVNDALGHVIGDRLLVSTAARLAETIRPNDHVARIGGDEFLVVCSRIPDAVTALDLAERIRRALTGRLKVKELDLEFSVSIGIAMSDADVLDLSDADAASALISNADTAMYDAKNSGRGRCALFTSQMRSAARERTELAAALSHAITARELTIEYQPVFSAVSQTAVGAEALVRWQHPTLGRVDPATFVAIAEESGSIGRLGEFVLRQALADARIWRSQQQIDEDFAVHANVSHMQLASTSFVPLVLALLREHRMQPRQLVLEAREATLLGTNIDVQRTIRALRRLGVQVAVDNFGTGANSLSVLTDVGADILKLDGSLALPSGSSEADTRLVRALVLLAHALDMRVVAERVSGAEQLRRLRAAGCDYVQGNLLAAPAPFGAFDPNLSF